MHPLQIGNKMVDLELILKTNTCISSTELEQLEQLTSQYPWFSLAHQLTLLGYKQTNNDAFNIKCRQTAIYTLNRKRLYKFLEKSTQLNKYTKEDNNTTPISDIDTAEANDIAKDSLLLNFSNEYFSIEDLPPIDITEEEESSNTLIDKFISTNPRIIPKSSPISDLDNLIQIDDDTEDEPISEMLAQIYVEQGLYDLAISCYEKLSLLNPEKSIYFASLIDNLRTKKK